MSILGTSPEATRVFNVDMANALGDMNAAIILQQLHYWMQKKSVGVVVDNAKYIYNTFEEWVNQQFSYLSVWKFRKAMNVLRSLEIVDVIRYKSKEWNQTNYYSLNYKRLREWAEAESIGISEMRYTSSQGGENQTSKSKNPESSIYEPKNTNQRETTKQERSASDRTLAEEQIIAAVSPKQASEGEENKTGSNPHSAGSTASSGQEKVKLEPKQSNSGKAKGSTVVDHIVNKNYKSLIPLLDSAGVLVNKTVRDLLKLYPSEKVESAIAILKARKREKHVLNPSGYFVAALKGDWESQSLVSNEGETEEVDKGAVFRHWYDLARSLGYCSGQEVREGEQYVCMSGSWESWESVVERGYSLQYLKKIVKRNSRQ